MLLVDRDVEDLGRAERVGDEDGRVVVPGDHVDLLAGELGHDGLDPGPALADGRPDRVEALLAARDGDLRARAGLAGDRLDLDGPAVDLGDLELEEPAEEALVGAADEDLRPAQAAPDLEDVGLDVLADAVVLERRLLGRGEDRLGPGDPALAGQVEDDRPRLDPVDGPGDDLALAARELVEDDVALGLAEPLEDDLLGRLGVDPAERLGVELLGLDEIAELGVRVVARGRRRR